MSKVLKRLGSKIKMKEIVFVFIWMVACFILGAIIADLTAHADYFTPTNLPEKISLEVSYNDASVKCKGTGNNWISLNIPELDRAGSICFPRTISNHGAVEKMTILLEAVMGQEVNYRYRTAQ